MRRKLLCLFLAVLWNLSFAGKSKRDNDYIRDVTNNCKQTRRQMRCYQNFVKMKIPNVRNADEIIELSTFKSLFYSSPNVLIKRPSVFGISVF